MKNADPFAARVHALIARAVSTEFIVRDRADRKLYGHNPSWVKVSDLQDALAAALAAALAPPQEQE